MSLTTAQYQQLLALTNWMNEVIDNSKTNEEMPAMTIPLDRAALIRASKLGFSKTFSIQDFIDDISSEFVLGNVPIKFRYVSVDYTTPGSITSKVAAAVNAIPNYVLEQGTAYYFFTIRTMLTNGPGFGGPGGPAFAIIKEHFAFTRKLDPDGDGVVSVGIDGSEVFNTDFYPSFILDSREFAPIEFDLGDIGATDINDAVDTSGPYSTPNVTTVIFNATQGGVAKSWIYIGISEEVGIGFNTTELTDYRLLDAGDVDPPPTNYPYPIYTPDTGTVILMQSRLGNYCNMETPSTEDVFELISYDYQQIGLIPPFATWARVLWNSAGKTAYPGISGIWHITLAGTSGTATVSIGGDDYLATFGDDLDDTAADFIATHAANILTDTGLVATNPSGNIIRLEGVNTEAVSIANTTGDLDGALSELAPVLIDSPDFEADVLYDMFVLCDGYQVNYSFRKRTLGETKHQEFACSDETSDLAIGTVYEHVLLRDFPNVSRVDFSVVTAPTGSTMIFDVQKNGVTIYTTKPTIDAGENTTLTAAIPQVLDGAISFVAGDILKVIIDQVGSTTPGINCKAQMTYNA